MIKIDSSLPLPKKFIFDNYSSKAERYFKFIENIGFVLVRSYNIPSCNDSQYWIFFEATTFKEGSFLEIDGILSVVTKFPGVDLPVLVIVPV